MTRLVAGEDPVADRLALLFVCFLSISMAISNSLFALLALRTGWRIAHGERPAPGTFGIVAAFLAFVLWQAVTCSWSPLGLAALAQVKVTHLLVFLVFAQTGPRILPDAVALLLSVNALLLLAAPLAGALEVSLVPFDRLATWATRYSGCFTMNIAYGTYLACVLLAALALGARRVARARPADAVPSPVRGTHGGVRKPSMPEPVKPGTGVVDPGGVRGGAPESSMNPPFAPPSASLRLGLFHGAVILCLIALLLTMSRSAWLGFWVGLNLLLWFRHRLLPVALHAAALGALAAMLFVPALRAQPLLSPLAERVELSLAGGSSGRHVLYACAKEMIRERPLFGHGVGAVPGLLDGMRDVMRRSDPGGAQHEVDFGHLHSNLLQVAAETGLVGVALYLALLAATARPFLARLRDDPADPAALAALAVVLCVFTVGLFEYNVTYSNVSRVQWLLVGACFAHRAGTVAGSEDGA